MFIIVNKKYKTAHFFDKNVSFLTLDNEKQQNFALQIYSVEFCKK